MLIISVSAGSLCLKRMLDAQCFGRLQLFARNHRKPQGTGGKREMGVGSLRFVSLSMSLDSHLV